MTRRTGWLWDHVYGRYAGMARVGGGEPIDSIDAIAKTHDGDLSMFTSTDFLRFNPAAYAAYLSANHKAYSEADRYLKDHHRRLNPRQRKAARDLKMLGTPGLIIGYDFIDKFR